MKKTKFEGNIKIGNFTFMLFFILFLIFVSIDRNLIELGNGSAILVYIVIILGTLLLVGWLFKFGIPYGSRMLIIFSMGIYLIFLIFYSLNTNDLEGVLYTTRIYAFLIIFFMFSYMRINNMKVLLISIILTVVSSFIFLNWLFKMELLRFTGFFDNPNTLAYFMFIILVFHILGYIRLENILYKFILISVIFIDLLLIYVSTSRAVWLSLFIGIFIFLIYFNFNINKFWHKVIFTVLLGLIILVTYIYPNLYNTKLGNQLDYYVQTVSGKGLFSGREKIFLDLFELIEQSPLIGHGVSASPTKYLYVGQGAHNTYISILYQTGFIGLILYITIIYLLWKNLHTNKQKLKNENVLFVALLSSLIIYQGFELALVQGPYSFRVLEWVLIAIGISIAKNSEVNVGEITYTRGD